MTDDTPTDGAITDGANTADDAEVHPSQMQVEVDEKMTRQCGGDDIH
jgi:hypothetical protein